MLYRKKCILFGLESAYATDPTLSGATDAVLTRDLTIKTFQGNKATLDYDRPYLAAGKQLHTGPYSTLDFTVDFAGGGTAGTAPPWGKLLRACGFAEIVNATAVTGTATAGGASTITLAGGASAVNNAYNGLLIRITSGTGSGQTRRVKGYVGSTKVATVSKAWQTNPDNTSVYSIDAQVVYAPVSDGFESGYSYYYLDGELHKLAGARGTVSVTLGKETIPELKFTLTGLRVAAAAGSVTADFSAYKEPLPVNKANTPLLMLHGYAAPTETIMFDIANTVTYRNVIQGEAVRISDRDPKMSVTIEKPDIGTKNFDAIIAAHTADEVYVVHGNTAGSILRVDGQLVQLIEPDFGDSDGLATQSMNGILLPNVGDDELFITLL